MSKLYVALLLAGMGLFYNWAPLSSAVFYFGRRVEPGFRESKDGRSILARYRLLLWMGCLVGIANAIVLPSQPHNHLGFYFGLLVEVLVSTLAYANANAAVGKFGVQPSRAVTVNLSRSYLPHSTLEWPALTPACIVVASVGLTLLFAHRGFDGNGFRWLSTSMDHANATGNFSVALGLLLSSTVILLMIRLRTRRTAAMARLTEQSGLMLAYLAAASVVVTCGAVALGYVIPDFARNATLWLSLGIVLLHVVRAMRGGWGAAPPEAELNDDRLWHWGLFYFNRQDPAVLVQKRCGTGLTLNFGHSVAWVVMLGFLVAMITVFVA
jgi:hypothetical protein